jgi:hypothetical protein
MQRWIAADITASIDVKDEMKRRAVELAKKNPLKVGFGL